MLSVLSGLVRFAESPGRGGCMFSKLEFRRGGFSPCGQSGGQPGVDLGNPAGLTRAPKLFA